ncbi:MAG: arginine--tRNA ligase [Nitrososphaeraceae archaeon]|nr:arginine--tRNA ligase [Nitrososphaeraceae archaeon]
MTLSSVIKEINNLLDLTFSELQYPKIEYEVTEPPLKEFGDLTTNIAFLLAKKTKKKPSFIAREIVEKIIVPRIEFINKNDVSVLQLAEAHPAGHINFKINYHIFSKFLVKLIEREEFGFLNIGKGKTIRIEHTSVNPNKPLHIGHLRNIVIGDTLYRLFKCTNHNVHVLNYIDDSGVQVADIIVAFLFKGFESKSINKNLKFDEYCGEIYSKINDIYQVETSLINKRNFIIKQIEEGNNKVSEFTWKIVKEVLLEQLKTCWRIKARYDILNIESQIIASGLWDKTFELLKQKDIIKYVTDGKNKNCWVFKPEREEEKVLVRSDGTATYVAKDIPYALWKLSIFNDPFRYVFFAEQWDGTTLLKTEILKNGSINQIENKDKIENNTLEEILIQPKKKIDKVITIIDSRQARLQNILLEIIKRLDSTKQEYCYLNYETVALSQQTVKEIGLGLQNENKRVIHMSGRKGIYISGDYILDQLRKKSAKEIKSRNSTMTEKDIDFIAEKIAISALRYSLIKRDRDKMITFDMQEELKLDGDTSLYLQYSYARAIRILEKAEHLTIQKPVNLGLLNKDIEKEIIKEILKYDIIIEKAIETLSPKILARYANELAAKFNVFYESVQVLQVENIDLKLARLSLVKSFTILFRGIFLLLGIEVLNKL